MVRTHKKIYKALSKPNKLEETADWKHNWCLIVPERVCMFLRLFRHDKLMTNSNKSKRG